MNAPVNIDEHIIAFLRGEISSDDKNILKFWISENAENKDYFKKQYLIWKSASILAVSEAEKDFAFARIKKQTVATSKPKAEFFLTRNVLKWAAVIAISVTSGYLLNQISNNSYTESRVATNEIQVPLGAKSTVVLPDGTTVWLNAGSKITYSAYYGQTNREVNLIGEAYFKVQKNPRKPFIVHTSGVSVKALGTEFNVKAYPNESKIETILVEGSVVVNNINSANNTDFVKQEVVLKPGQKIAFYNEVEKAKKDTYTKNKISTETIAAVEVANPEVETSWKNEKWLIGSETLGSLFVTLSRRYNINIDVNNASILKYKFSGTIHKETLEQVFEIISLTVPISYTIEKGIVEVKLNKDLEKRYKAAYSN